MKKYVTGGVAKNWVKQNVRRRVSHHLRGKPTTGRQPRDEFGQVDKNSYALWKNSTFRLVVQQYFYDCIIVVWTRRGEGQWDQTIELEKP